MSNDNEILLIDDDEADVELALHALRENKLANHIHVLRDGEEALDYLFGPGRDEQAASGQTPKLILLDLKLPKVDGIEVLRRLKSDAATKFIPVVILDQFRKIVMQVGLYWLVINQPAPIRAKPVLI
jgi:CheY-like chemotaxis protein